MTTSNGSDHALPIHGPMACIKSVFTAFFTKRRNRRVNFSQLAQVVKIGIMRPTVDYVYSRRRSLYFETLILRLYRLHVGCLLFPKLSASQNPNSLSIIFSTSFFYLHKFISRETGRTAGLPVPLRSNPCRGPGSCTHTWCLDAKCMIRVLETLFTSSVRRFSFRVCMETNGSSMMLQQSTSLLCPRFM